MHCASNFNLVLFPSVHLVHIFFIYGTGFLTKVSLPVALIQYSAEAQFISDIWNKSQMTEKNLLCVRVFLVCVWFLWNYLVGDGWIMHIFPLIWQLPIITLSYTKKAWHNILTKALTEKKKDTVLLNIRTQPSTAL